MQNWLYTRDTAGNFAPNRRFSRSDNLTLSSNIYPRKTIVATVTKILDENINKTLNINDKIKKTMTSRRTAKIINLNIEANMTD